MLLAGCQKFPGTGKAIRFSAVTRSEAVGTKTAYSGVVDASGYERIDWVAGDRILVAMKNNEENYAQQAYDITGIKTSGRYSNASIEMPGGGTGGLQWGTGTHDFWAAYPSTATVGDHSITSTIPAAQTLTYKSKTNGINYYAPDMTKALLVAGTQVTSPGGDVTLAFEPAFTTFEFTVGANSDIVIKSFEMETTTSGESTYQILSGDATATFNSSMACTYSAIGTTGQSITTIFSPAAAVSTTTSLNFKVFAVPQDIQGVRIIFTLNDDSTKSLNLTKINDTTPTPGTWDQWIKFNARSLVRITGLLVPGATWTITMDGPRVEQWTIVPDIEFGVE